ncbi:hypothetical protein D3C85_457040 [compost metagenome]
MQRYPHLDIDTSYIYGKLNRRRKAYRREQLAKRVCPVVIFVATMGTLGYLLVTRLF